MENLESSYDEKIKAIKQMLQLFKFERAVYLSITILSLIVLLGCAFYLLKQGANQITAVVGMFASSGGIGYTCGRLLKMWSDAMQLLGSIQNND